MKTLPKAVWSVLAAVAISVWSAMAVQMENASSERDEQIVAGAPGFYG